MGATFSLSKQTLTQEILNSVVSSYVNKIDQTLTANATSIQVVRLIPSFDKFDHCEWTDKTSTDIRMKIVANMNAGQQQQVASDIAGEFFNQLKASSNQSNEGFSAAVAALVQNTQLKQQFTSLIQNSVTNITTNSFSQNAANNQEKTFKTQKGPCLYSTIDTSMDAVLDIYTSFLADSIQSAISNNSDVSKALQEIDSKASQKLSGITLAVFGVIGFILIIGVIWFVVSSMNSSDDETE